MVRFLGPCSLQSPDDITSLCTLVRMDDKVMNEWNTLSHRWQRAWTRADRASRTLHDYLLDVEAYRKWCAQTSSPILSLDSADEWVSHRERDSKYAGRNAARALKALGKFLAEQYDEPDPFKRLTVPKPPAPVKTPTATNDDLAALLATCETDWLGQRDRCVILTMAHTGMRRGEVAKMKWEHVDLAKETLTIPKTKTRAPRTVWLHEHIITAMLKFKKLSPSPEWCWPSYGFPGSPVTAEGIGQMVKRREKEAGLKLGTHAWRRKYAGDWLGAGGTESGLMATAGWSSTNMVAMYAKDVAQKNAQAEARRLFER